MHRKQGLASGGYVQLRRAPAFRMFRSFLSCQMPPSVTCCLGSPACCPSFALYIHFVPLLVFPIIPHPLVFCFFTISGSRSAYHHNDVEKDFCIWISVGSFGSYDLPTMVQAFMLCQAIIRISMNPFFFFPFQVIRALAEVEVNDFTFVNVLKYPAIREGVKKFSEWPTIPQLFVGGEFVGGCDIVMSLHKEGELRQLMKDKNVYSTGDESDKSGSGSNVDSSQSDGNSNRSS